MYSGCIDDLITAFDFLSQRNAGELKIFPDSNAYQRMSETIKACFKDTNANLVFSIFNGECTMKEIGRITEECRKSGCNAIIVIGGGKPIDTAKVVADNNSIPLIVVPTVVSNDAPCTGLSVVYNEEGMDVKIIFTRRNPDLVLVDSEIISKAPVRFFDDLYGAIIAADKIGKNIEKLT